MGKPVYTDLDFSGGAKLTGLPASTAAGEAVTHEQLAAAIEGVAWKDDVRVSTQGNINLSSPGSSIDGVTMATSDRVLVRAQSTPAQNGIYIWNGAAVAMTRSADASTFNELESAIVPVSEGTDAGTAWRQTQVNGTIDSSNVVFTDYGSATPAASETVAGKVELATTAETSTGTDTTRAVTPAGLAASTHAKKKFAADFGDASATQFDFTHNFNTLDVIARVVLNSTGEDVECAIRRTGVNAVRVNVNAAPASNALRIIIIG